MTAKKAKPTHPKGERETKVTTLPEQKKPTRTAAKPNTTSGTVPGTVGIGPSTVGIGSVNVGSAPNTQPYGGHFPSQQSHGPIPPNVITPGSVQTSPHVSQPNSSIQSTYSGSLRTSSDESWLLLIAEIGALRGHATVEFARFLLNRQHSPSMIAAVQLAVELLDGSDEMAYENLVTLLRDGWEQSIGQLLNCARTL